MFEYHPILVCKAHDNCAHKQDGGKLKQIVQELLNYGGHKNNSC